MLDNLLSIATAKYLDSEPVMQTLEGIRARRAKAEQDALAAQDVHKKTNIEMQGMQQALSNKQELAAKVQQYGQKIAQLRAAGENDKADMLTKQLQIETAGIGTAGQESMAIGKTVDDPFTNSDRELLQRIGEDRYMDFQKALVQLRGEAAAKANHITLPGETGSSDVSAFTRPMSASNISVKTAPQYEQSVRLLNDDLRVMSKNDTNPIPLDSTWNMNAAANLGIWSGDRGTKLESQYGGVFGKPDFDPNVYATYADMLKDSVKQTYEYYRAHPNEKDSIIKAWNDSWQMFDIPPPPFLK